MIYFKAVGTSKGIFNCHVKILQIADNTKLTCTQIRTNRPILSHVCTPHITFKLSL